MKHLILLLATAFMSITSLIAQSKDIKFVMDSAIAIMKVNAINRDKVDWKSVEYNVHSQIMTVKNGYQLGPVCRYLFQAINDYHGAFYCGDSTYKWHRPEREVSDSILNEWKKGVSIRNEILTGGIGYLRVPYMSFEERSKLDTKSQTLNDSLCALLQDGVKGVVLDLRLNGGGAMYPMMLGLEQLLGNGKIGSFVGGDNQLWVIKDNSFYLDTLLLTSIIPKCQTPAKEIPVAVLIGQGTGSSGEFLAISFKNRKNTVLIGTETAGYVTGTKGFRINDAVSILLANCYGKDRTGQIFDQALVPDIVNNDSGSFNDIKNDKQVLAAVKWLKSAK